MGEGGLTVCTSDVLALPTDTVGAIGDAVRDFESFDPGNDPYGEHDFGALTVGGHRILFKIDAYDINLIMASPNPSDPTVTKRVLTIMLAEEY